MSTPSPHGSPPDHEEAVEYTLGSPIEDPRLDRAAHVLVPVGLAVFAWLTVLIAAGTVARLDGGSVLNIVPLLLVAFLFWPLYLAAPWKAGATGRVLRWAYASRRVFPVAAVLLVVPYVPFAPDLLASLLTFPFRIVGVLFGVGLFYGRLVAPWFGDLLVAFGQWYFVGIWVYVLASAAVGLVGRLR